MKKENGFLIASGIGLFAVLGIIALKKFLNLKQDWYDDDYYSDFHRHFENRPIADENYGVEYI